MFDLAPLRPRDGSPSAIAEALARTQVAARGLAPELARLANQRAALLVLGTPEALHEAEAALTEAKTTGDRIMALHQELERMLASAAPNEAERTEQLSRAQATQAVADFTAWWTRHGAEVQRGLTLFLQTTVAIAAAHGAARASRARAASQPSGDNILRMSPPGAA